MLVLGKKLLKIENRALKLGIVLGLALFWAFSFTESVLASVDESFEVYNLGNINSTCHNNWYGLNKVCPYEFGFIVNTERASEGLKSIKSHSTSSDLLGASELWYATTTGLGIFSFDFIIERKPVWASVELASDFTDSIGVVIGTCCSSNPYDTENWDGIRFDGIDLTDNVSNNVWHRVSIQYDFNNDWARANYDFGEWSATTTLDFSEYFNRYIFRSGGDELKTIYFDNFTNVGECNSTCIYCDFDGCQDYDLSCTWNFDDGQCQPLILGIPDIQLPTEDCSGLSITERLLCEIKNFFYRLFVPTPEKITELRETINLVKDRFPYSYLLEFKDFFVYLKDNIDDEQPVNFKIFNQSATLNFAFWNTTSTIAGTEQSIKDIIQKVFGFLIIVGFGFWCFSFLKRVFK